MAFHVTYKFLDDVTPYSCYMTYDQYLNFKKLPSVQDVTINNKTFEEMTEYREEMQHAINRASENNTTHIKRLSTMT